MAGWVFQWISSVRARFRQRGDLVLELIVLRHQLAVLQRTGTRRPCLRPDERLLWVLAVHRFQIEGAPKITHLIAAEPGLAVAEAKST
jgi:hypothetical protein